ncbi:MAG: gamma-butyrobetaine hydroxylase-like domain-containing protein [Caldilineaceae bacterium]
MTVPTTRPLDIAIEREQARLNIRWSDGHASGFALPWLRANCPCATCREERRERAASGGLVVSSGPPPSAVVVGAELVGLYAMRLDWGDGHATGIYPFGALRAACPCVDCNPGGSPPLLPD